MDARYNDQFVNLIINGDEMHLAAGPEGVRNAIKPLFKTYLRGVNEAAAKKSIEKVMNKKIDESAAAIMTTGKQAKFESVHIEKALETIDCLMGFGIFNFYVEQMNKKTGRMAKLDTEALNKLARTETNGMSADQAGN